jgi:uncharacterized membrane protein
MASGLVALLIAGLFTGAALYVNLVEQPARLLLDDRALLAQWKPSYKRGFAMQAPLAFLGFVLGLLAWRQSGAILFLIGGVLMLANWPWTLLAILPLNNRLMTAATGDAQTRVWICRWNSLHAVRTCLGASAAAVFIAAFLWR